jgi:hypothetical protein
MTFSARATAFFIMIVCAGSVRNATGQTLDFQAFSSLSVGKSAIGLDAADLDGDGSLDLVSADSELDKLTLFLKKGETFIPGRTVSPAGGRPQEIAAGDLDRDGDTDLFVNYGPTEARVFWNDGGGTFSQERSIYFPFAARSPRAVDLDGDGAQDVVVASPGTGLQIIRKGGGSVLSPSLVVPMPAGLGPFVATDVEGDGDLDLVSGTFDFPAGPAAVWLSRNRGDGSFETASRIHEGGSPSSIEALDLGGDGFPDVAVANSSDESQHLFILRNSGSGSGFQSAVSVPVESNALRLAAGDFDGDSDVDLASTHYDPGRLSIIANDGSGSLTAGETFTIGSHPSSIVARDLDRDGRVDLAVSRSHGGNGGTIALLRIDARGNFLAAEELWTTHGVRARNAALADLNGDGRLDVAACTLHSIYPFFGTDEGPLAPGASFPTLGYSLFIAAGDSDGDGDVDLLTINGSINAPISKAVGLLENDGQGTFAPAVAASLGGEPSFLFLSDLDGRNGPDLVVGTSRLTGLEVFRSAGGKAFDPGPKLPLDGEPTSITGADLNLDGNLDLVVSTVRNTPFAVETLVYENPGNGEFASARLKFAGDLAAFTGDIDQDGDADIVTSNSVIHENRGDGSLTSRQPLQRGPTSLSVIGDDFDGDGMLDLAFAHVHSDEVALFRNEGGSSFASPVAFATATQPIFLASGDLEGDGLPDLVAAHMDLDMILLVRNRSGLSFPAFHRGDSNGDGHLDISDGLHLLNYLYSDGREPGCRDASDATDDAALDCGDAVFLFGYLFLGTPVPPAPGPPGSPCGRDTGSGSLGCEAYSRCD